MPDVYHILIKSKGVFTNVASPSAKAKLRLLYECVPIALLVEAAGGARFVWAPLSLGRVLAASAEATLNHSELPLCEGHD